MLGAPKKETPGSPGASMSCDVTPYTSDSRTNRPRNTPSKMAGLRSRSLGRSLQKHPEDFNYRGTDAVYLK